MKGEKMKEKLEYLSAECEIVYLGEVDVITASDPNGEVGNNGGNIDGDAWE